MSIPYAFFITIVYAIACLGMGSIVFISIPTLSSKISASPLTVLATKFLLGQGILANAWVFTALAGFFSPFFVKSLVSILFLAGVWLNYKTLFPINNQLTEIWKEVKQETLSWKATIGATLLVCLIWLPFWFPLETSGSRYYMAIAKVISASEHLKLLPGYEEVASLGMQGEVQFAALMTLGSPESTQFFSWVTFVAGCVLLLALGRQVGLKRRGQWIVLAMVFTSSAVILLSGSGKTDLYGAAFAFAAYYWALRLDEENRTQASILIGLFSGMAVMAKLNYAVNFLPSLALVLIWKIFLQPGQKKPKEKLIPFLIMGMGGLFIAVQMPIKNQILFGDPLAAFHSEDISSQVWYGAETIRRVYTLLPLSLTFGAFWGQGGGVSPLILAFLPLLFFLPKQKNWLRNSLFVLSFTVIFGLACWFIFYPSNFALRYFMACVLLLTLPVAKITADFVSLGKSNERLIHLSITIYVVYTILGYISYPIETGTTFRQVATGEANCSNENIRCLITNQVNNELHLGERIFTYTRHRYWLRPDLIQCASTTEELNNFASINSSDLRWRYLIGRGFHIIFFENRNTTIPNIIRKDLKEIPSWLKIAMLQNDQNIFFIKLTPAEYASTHLFECKQTIPPSWDVFEISSP
ncbi:MAG: hypothetical protein U0V18_15305 [Anaerolineales bacterium]